MDAVQAIPVRRVEHSEDLAAPGDYVFIAKREPKVIIEKRPLLPPEGFLKRLWWNLFAEKYELKQTIENVWPDHDTVIVNCPVCKSPSATTDRQTIMSLDPLTLDGTLTCPYCQTVSFGITDGKLTTA